MSEAPSHAEEGLGLRLDERDEDKYSLGGLPEIDCADRVALCGAACCRMRFALSRQDVEEGVIRFDLGRPYLNRVAASGYCVHFDDGGCRCTVYEQRPGVCRRYDCRQDPRIWLDFEARVPSPILGAKCSPPAGEKPTAAGRLTPGPA